MPAKTNNGLATYCCRARETDQLLVFTVDWLLINSIVSFIIDNVPGKETLLKHLSVNARLPMTHCIDAVCYWQPRIK
jgi:hypothetical protein